MNTGSYTVVVMTDGPRNQLVYKNSNRVVTPIMKHIKHIQLMDKYGHACSCTLTYIAEHVPNNLMYYLLDRYANVKLCEYTNYE